MRARRAQSAACSRQYLAYEDIRRSLRVLELARSRLPIHEYRAVGLELKNADFVAFRLLISCAFAVTRPQLWSYRIERSGGARIAAPSLGLISLRRIRE